MKKLFCMLCCAMLALSAVSCALAAEAGELATATSLKAYLTTVGWDDYTATDADGDGFDDEIMISYNANGHTDSDTIDIYCQCLDGAARVVSRLCSVPEDADPLKVYEQINEFNLNLSRGRWLYNEEDGYVYYTQEVYMVDEGSFGAYVFSYMYVAASYVYSFYDRFTSAIQ